MASSWPKTAQDDPEIVPRPPQDRLRMPQDCPKTATRRARAASRWPQVGPRWARTVPRQPQDQHKTAPNRRRAAQKRYKSHQDAPRPVEDCRMAASRPLQDPQKRLEIAPRCAIRHKSGLRTSQDGLMDDHGVLIMAGTSSFNITGYYRWPILLH